MARESVEWVLPPSDVSRDGVWPFARVGTAVDPVGVGCDDGTGGQVPGVTHTGQNVRSGHGVVTVDVRKVVNHTWYGMHAHVLRSNGRVVRAVIGELLFKPYGIYLRARFRSDDRTRSKDVDPVTVACVHHLWRNVDVVSDDEIPDEDDVVVPGLVTEECVYTLPMLAVGNDTHLTTEQRSAFECVSRHANNITNITDATGE